MGFLSSLFGGNRPPHLKGYHKESVKQFYAIREKIGDPFSQDMEKVINEIVKIELKLPPNQQLDGSMRIINDLGCDLLDLVELTLTIEDQFEKKIKYPLWFEDEPEKVKAKSAV